MTPDFRPPLASPSRRLKHQLRVDFEQAQVEGGHWRERYLDERKARAPLVQEVDECVRSVPGQLRPRELSTRPRQLPAFASKGLTLCHLALDRRLKAQIASLESQLKTAQAALTRNVSDVLLGRSVSQVVPPQTVPP